MLFCHETHEISRHKRGILYYNLGIVIKRNND